MTSTIIGTRSVVPTVTATTVVVVSIMLVVSMSSASGMDDDFDDTDGLNAFDVQSSSSFSTPPPPSCWHTPILDHPVCWTRSANEGEEPSLSSSPAPIIFNAVFHTMLVCHIVTAATALVSGWISVLLAFSPPSPPLSSSISSSSATRSCCCCCCCCGGGGGLHRRSGKCTQTTTNSTNNRKNSVLLRRHQQCGTVFALSSIIAATFGIVLVTIRTYMDGFFWTTTATPTPTTTSQSAPSLPSSSSLSHGFITPVNFLFALFLGPIIIIHSALGFLAAPTNHPYPPLRRSEQHELQSNRLQRRRRQVSASISIALLCLVGLGGVSVWIFFGWICILSYNIDNKNGNDVADSDSNNLNFIIRNVDESWHDFAPIVLLVCPTYFIIHAWIVMRSSRAVTAFVATTVTSSLLTTINNDDESGFSRNEKPRRQQYQSYQASLSLSLPATTTATDPLSSEPLTTSITTTTRTQRSRQRERRRIQRLPNHAFHFGFSLTVVVTVALGDILENRFWSLSSLVANGVLVTHPPKIDMTLVHDTAKVVVNCVTFLVPVSIFGVTVYLSQDDIESNTYSGEYDLGNGDETSLLLGPA